jgi:hypothetical protein
MGQGLHPEETFHKEADMPSGWLQQYHGAIIEVELNIQGQPRTIKGKGVYDPRDPELGHVLRIVVSDRDGDIEFLLAESKCADLPFEQSAQRGCDYRVSLASQFA